MLNNIALMLVIISGINKYPVSLAETDQTKYNLFLPYKTYYGLPMECIQYRKEFDKCQVQTIKQWSLMIIQYVRLDFVWKKN